MSPKEIIFDLCVRDIGDEVVPRGLEAVSDRLPQIGDDRPCGPAFLVDRFTVKELLFPGDELVRQFERQAEHAQKDLHGENLGEIGHELGFAAAREALDQVAGEVLDLNLHRGHPGGREYRDQQLAPFRMVRPVGFKREQRPTLSGQA